MKGRTTKFFILALFLTGSLASNSFINHNLADSDTVINVEVELVDKVDNTEQSTSFKVLDFRYISAVLEKITEIAHIL